MLDISIQHRQQENSSWPRCLYCAETESVVLGAKVEQNGNRPLPWWVTANFESEV